MCSLLCHHNISLAVRAIHLIELRKPTSCYARQLCFGSLTVTFDSNTWGCFNPVCFRKSSGIPNATFAHKSSKTGNYVAGWVGKARLEEVNESEQIWTERKGRGLVFGACFRQQNAWDQHCCRACLAQCANTMWDCKCGQEMWEKGLDRWQPTNTEQLQALSHKSVLNFF